MSRADDPSCREPRETSIRRGPEGEPPPQELEDRSKDDLYQIAKRLKIEGRSRMSQEQLVNAIRRRQ